MAMNLLSWSPLRTSGSILGPLSACRWNSTATPTHPSSRGIPRRRMPSRQKFIEDQRIQAESRMLEKFQTREWKAGDVYAPHDLSSTEMTKWRRRSSPSTDAFDALNLNPTDLYKNFSVMSEFITPMGRIKHRNVTGLRPVNQRKIAKAIRRAVGLGLMPSVHRHPEILAAELRSKMG
ncbi:ribosomal protein S18 [Aspergillus steynii IBT 23096]|uniref:Small ribosomal subunit protein bS18m n=1 Tax=Aspergillus steynii IBT 23096 TaxID=1392250 RepID=A0A2I2GC73_9EURO|nr:ribosomal protein S18 [Aspergillus steynii IBT 23096]PLB50479.1 ribosomal protein S18 [Aspergillus steynii IBT 23096]